MSEGAGAGHLGLGLGEHLQGELGLGIEQVVRLHSGSSLVTFSGSAYSWYTLHSAGRSSRRFHFLELHRNI